MKRPKSNSVPCIVVENISKCFHIYDGHYKLLRQFFINLVCPGYRFGALGRRLYREHWALRDVSFKMAVGEAVAIIGRNGSGKSTLLQILAGTMGPTEGSVTVNGRVTALLELGSGFNSAFTGRENVILNAQILGLSRKQALEKYDEVADFAELGDFIDQPVMTYSTGMIMRLGFAVQTVLDPDLLIIDEALAVGDAKFQDKCYRKLRTLRDHGTSILFVSHDMNAVTSFCDRSILLDEGKVRFIGDPATAAKSYMKLLYSQEHFAGSCGPFNDQHMVEHVQENHHLVSAQAVSVGFTNRFGNGLLEILSVEIRDETGNQVKILDSGRKFSIAQIVKAHSRITGLSSGFIIRNAKGLEIFGITNSTAKVTIPDLRVGDEIKISINCEMWLAAGEYFLQAANSDHLGMQYDCLFDAIHFIVVGTNALFANSLVNLNPEFLVQNLKD